METLVESLDVECDVVRGQLVQNGRVVETEDLPDELLHERLLDLVEVLQEQLQVLGDVEFEVREHT